MRTVTAGEQTLLEGSEYGVHVIVRYENPDGTMVRMDTLEGHNWIQRVTYGESVDQPIIAGDIYFARTQTHPTLNLSLEPLDESSDINRDSGDLYAPFLDAGQKVEVHVATVTLGAAKPAFPGSEWQWVVDGETDRWYHPGGDLIGVRFRDRIGSQLQDRWVELDREYGANDESKQLEDVIQDILTDWTTGHTLEVPVASEFAIRKYNQAPMPVMQAIRTLAQLRGWEVRVRWDNAQDDFRVTLYAPNREPVGTDWSFAENRVIGVRRLEVDRSSVRNAIVVTYPGPGSPRTRTDPTSIARFRRRFFRAIEGSESPLDTQAEAETFADAILADRKDPVADQEIEKMYWWPGEVGDYYEFQPLRPFYNVAQSFGVTGIHHELSLNSHRTFVATRGKPAGQYTEWNKFDADNRPPDFSVPAIVNFRDRHLEEEQGVQFDWSLNSVTTEVRVYDRVVGLPETGENWPTEADTPTAVLSSTDPQTYTALYPSTTTVRLVQIVPYDAGGRPGDFKRIRISDRGLSVIVPHIKVEPSQAGNLATLRLTVDDPDTRVVSVQFKSISGAGDFDATDPTDGTWTTDPSVPYQATETIGAKHGARIAGAVGYIDELSQVRYLVFPHPFDADEVAEITSVEISFDAAGVIVASPTGDEDTEAIFVTASAGGDPPDPMATDVSILGRSGSVATGVVCPLGTLATVKARGRSVVSGDLGPVQRSSGRRGLGIVAGKPVITPGHTFRSQNESAVYSIDDDGALTTDVGTTRVFFGFPVIPEGGIIREVSIEWSRDHADDVLHARFWLKTGPLTGAILAEFNYTSGTGVQVPSSTFTSTANPGFHYYWRVEMTRDASGLAKLFRATVVYDSSDVHVTP